VKRQHQTWGFLCSVDQTIESLKYEILHVFQQHPTSIHSFPSNNATTDSNKHHSSSSSPQSPSILQNPQSIQQIRLIHRPPRSTNHKNANRAPTNSSAVGSTTSTTTSTTEIVLHDNVRTLKQYNVTDQTCLYLVLPIVPSTTKASAFDQDFGTHDTVDDHMENDDHDDDMDYSGGIQQKWEDVNVYPTELHDGSGGGGSTSGPSPRSPVPVVK
jgi:hypothetical protein